MKWLWAVVAVVVLAGGCVPPRIEVDVKGVGGACCPCDRCPAKPHGQSGAMQP